MLLQVYKAFPSTRGRSAQPNGPVVGIFVTLPEFERDLINGHALAKAVGPIKFAAIACNPRRAAVNA